MENNLSPENKLANDFFQQKAPTMDEIFPTDHEQDPMTDNNMVEKGKHLSSDDEDDQMNEEAEMVNEIDSNNEEKKTYPYLVRVKWTDTMVKLLILALSYICDIFISNSKGSPGVRRRYLSSQKKGKWKTVSKVMTERGFIVSPQQCEDKYNDLNKKYKRLNEILGRGISCKIVERPILLDKMDHLSDKLKAEVRKILSTKQLFYEELCSYHNGNRLHLPHDPELQRTLQSQQKSMDDNESDLNKHSLEEVDENDHDNEETDDNEETEDDHGCASSSLAKPKRMKQGKNQTNQDFKEGFHMQSLDPPIDYKSFRAKLLELEERKIKLELEGVELEKEQINWEKSCKEEDRKLEKMRMRNKKLKLENIHLAVELKHMEMSMNKSKSDN